jgi:UDPglucose 6-dehydrogenase
MLDLARLKNLLAQPCMVDLRNVYSPESVIAAGFTYRSVGR